MKRFTLIIDGHNFFFRSLWSVFKQKDNKILDSQKDKDTFEKKLMVEFCQLMKNLNPIVNDVVFVKDSHSWRKDLLLQQEYKGNRKKSQDNINMVNFAESINNFTDTIVSMGVKVSQVDRCEGDDLISIWSDYLFEKGKSSLILSTDKDLTQLVKCVNDVHIIQYSPISNKLYVSAETQENVEECRKKVITEENIFGEQFAISVESDAFEKFFDSTEVEIVNPEFVRFTKIVGGDTSDNIFPVYYKKGDGETRSKGIGAKTVVKIYNAFKEKLGCEFDYHIYNDNDAMILLSNTIYDVAKIKDEEFTRKMLIENIKTNVSLVSLTKESIPEDLVSNMTDNIIEESEKRQIAISKITKEVMFTKSRFKEYKSSIQIKSNILKDIIDDGDMSFIKD